MCYILCMCVCVGASDSTTTSDDPNFFSLCVVCVGRFPGVPRGGQVRPPWLCAVFGSGAKPQIFFWRFLLF
jgi:hypothetical protein